jgi:hypothetical protein
MYSDKYITPATDAAVYQSSSGWITNMELYTNSSPIITTVLNVNGSVKSNGVTLSSSENIKEKIRDIYDPLDLINSFTAGI